MNREQFSILYEANSDAIFRFSFLRVSDRETALDITQDAFSRLWQAFQKGLKVENPRAFLYTTTRNLIIDWYRKKKPTSLDALADEETEEEFTPSGELESRGDLELAAEARLLIERIRDLGPLYRQAVYLRYVEGLPPAEIGSILGISEGTASVRIHRGIEELKKITDHHHE